MISTLNQLAEATSTRPAMSGPSSDERFVTALSIVWKSMYGRSEDERRRFNAALVELASLGGVSHQWREAKDRMM